MSFIIFQHHANSRFPNQIFIILLTSAAYIHICYSMAFSAPWLTSLYLCPMLLRISGITPIQMGRAVAALIPGHKQVNLAEGKANDETYIKLVCGRLWPKPGWKTNHNNSQIDGLVRKNVPPSLMYWIYIFLAPTHRNDFIKKKDPHPSNNNYNACKYSLWKCVPVQPTWTTFNWSAYQKSSFDVYRAEYYPEILYQEPALCVLLWVGASEFYPKHSG